MEEIAARAYTYYDQEGRRDGRANDHWLRAEADLLRERLQARPSPPDGRLGEKDPENPDRN